MLGPRGESEVEKFWHDVANQEWAQAHPCQEYGAEALKHMFPVGVHGVDLSATWK